MDLRLLRTFLAVVETGSFTAAAQMLNCVQSNVTSQIRRLEDEFGQRLFHRGKAGARLTWFGEVMRARAEAILRLVGESEAELREAAGSAAPLNIGTLETVAATHLPAVLKHVRTRCADAQISLRTGPTAVLRTLLWQRDIDAAFLAGPVDDDQFRSIRAFREDLVCVRPKAGSEAAPLLAFPSGCSYRAMAERWLDKTTPGTPQIIDLGSLDGILGCVDAGLGFAVIPRSALGTYRGHENFAVSPLPHPFDAVEIHLAWRHDHRPVAAHRALIGMFSTAGSDAARV